LIFFSLIILFKKNTLLDLNSIPNEKYFSLALFEGHLYTFSIIAVNPGFPRLFVLTENRPQWVFNVRTDPSRMRSIFGTVYCIKWQRIENRTGPNCYTLYYITDLSKICVSAGRQTVKARPMTKARVFAVIKKVYSNFMILYAFCSYDMVGFASLGIKR